MPTCGSQIILCDVPIRFDTYNGCSHACSYCFVKAKTDIKKISKGETPNSLRAFIEGSRTQVTSWCDFDIPLHWGGMSDPFQPTEKYQKISLECLKIFAETKYPFIVSTKNALVATEPYLSLIKQCNCVVQFSAACPAYDKFEKGASSFRERIEAAAKISPYKRVNIRIQPYILQYHSGIEASLSQFADAGVYGIIVESMKFKKKLVNTLVKVGGDYCYPIKMLYPNFVKLKELAHKLGLKFYSGENRLRNMGDDLCCCGVDGLGWMVNKANMNHFLFDRENYEFSDRMKIIGEGTACFKSLKQDTISTYSLKINSFEQLMREYEKTASDILTPK